MKRPIAELLFVTLNAGTETERRQIEQEAWQILRRKQGYVTHRIYQEASEPLQHLVYSEWESKKAVDGARQYLQGTPLMRRARNALTNAPRRELVEFVGPVTSTKGLTLPTNAVAAMARIHLAADDGTSGRRHEQLWKALASEPGHMTHVLFHGFNDPSLIGSLSHWADGGALKAAWARLRALADTEIFQEMKCVQYTPIHD